MKTIINILIFLLTLLSFQKRCIAQSQSLSLAEVLIPSYQVENNKTDSTYSKFQFSVIPFVGTNGKFGAPSTVDYSFNLFGGYNKNIRKLEVGGIFNADLGNVQWIQYAGVANIVWKNLTGLQFAGCTNIVNGDVNGGQFSGITNIVRGNILGVQYAGIANINKRKLYGIQVAGILNHTEDSVLGFQIAGVLNNNMSVARGVSIAGISNNQFRKIEGSQIAGIANIASEGIEGIQIAGIVNLSNRKTNGSQIAGFLNVANKISGSQIGVFNFSDSINGVPIGFFSYANNGFHKLELSANELFYLNAAFITGVDAFHNIFTAGIRNDDSGNPLWTIGYGIGSKIKLSKVVALNIDITSNQISRGEFTSKINLLNKGYLGVDVKLTKKISITTGPELNAYFTNTTYKKYPALFSDVKPHVFYNEQSKKDNLDVKMWLGWKFGIRLF
jgi:hypothetical protein